MNEITQNPATGEVTMYVLVDGMPQLRRVVRRHTTIPEVRGSTYVIEVPETRENEHLVEEIGGTFRIVTTAK